MAKCTKCQIYFRKSQVKPGPEYQPLKNFTSSLVSELFLQPKVQIDASEEGLVDCMWTHLRVQMDVSTDQLVAAHGHPRTIIQMDTEAGGLADEPE